MVDRCGTPLSARLTGANRRDRMRFEGLLDAIPPIRRPNGRRRTRPAEPHADRSDDGPRCRRALSRRRIKVRVARTGVDPSDRRGRHRRVVERAPARLGRSRRLTIRDERRHDVHGAFPSLGRALIRFSTLTRF